MEAFSLVLLGATGDLARLKILPGLYELRRRGLLPRGFSLIANGRSEYDDEKYRDYVVQIWRERYGANLDQQVVSELVSQIYYIQGDLTDEGLYKRLSEYLDKLLKAGVECGNRIFHLAILPSLYEEVVEKLGSLSLHQSDCGFVRILLEKPFGSSRQSAVELDSCLKKYFSEKQIFRIDHYLAKETVQNILYFRFANELFEPTLNNQFVDHIQISMMEEFGIRDRGRFYDRVGAVRDVLQNHLLQLLASVTMDKPQEMRTELIRAARQKLMTELVCPNEGELSKHIVKGQYEGYRGEKDVDDESMTETYVAVKALIDNDRWRGVPIYIRAGKALCRTVTEVAVIYKDTSVKPSPNVLNFRIQPDESIVLRFYVTKPGPTDELQQANLQFHYHQLKQHLMAAYERVLLDAFSGNQTLFTLASGVEAEWKFVDPILNYWSEKKIEPFVYAKGSWGPKEADELLMRDGREWIELSVDLDED